MPETTIIWIVSILQIAIAFGLVNVWIVRRGRETRYRGGGAKNMKEEFAVYGLPEWSLYIVGFFKITIALIMILGLFISYIMYPFGVLALALLVALMLGAVFMHIKVKDPLIKIVPAMLMLSMALSVIYLVAII